MKCNQCGNYGYSTNYIAGETKRTMDKKGMCFNCAFWINVKEKRNDDPLWVRIDGQSFHMFSVLPRGMPATAQQPRGKMKGFGGREFCIKFHDGRLVRTGSLWTQGEMPGWLRETHPDNAEFITREEFDALEAVTE